MLNQGSRSALFEKSASKDNVSIYYKDSLREIGLEEEQNEADPNKQQQGGRRKRAEKKDGTIIMKSKRNIPIEQKDLPSDPEEPWKKGFTEDFKKYIEMKKSRRHISIGNAELSDQLQTLTISQKKQEISKEDEEQRKKAASVNKHKQQTLKILAEITKKLKITQKSKQDKFEQSMALFKNTETYIEIRPFLEKLNMFNNQKYLQQVKELERNIEQAQESKNHNKSVYKLKQFQITQSNSTFNILESPKGREDLIFQQQLLDKAKRDQDLIQKANNALLQADNNSNFKHFQAAMMDQLMEQLGLSRDEFSTETRKQNPFKNENEDSTLQSPHDTSPNEQNKKNKGYLSLKDRDGINKVSDENQFFENLRAYLGKEQKQINIRDEMEDEMSAYQKIIEQNQKKLDELRQNQFKGILGDTTYMREQLESDKNLDSNKFHEKFREKAQQAQITLNKINQSLFQKKWANAQMKRQMERQKERNELFSKFKQNNTKPEIVSFLSPSHKMNKRLLAEKLKNQKAHEKLSFMISTPIKEVKEEHVQQTNKQKNEIPLQVRRKTIPINSLQHIDVSDQHKQLASTQQERRNSQFHKRVVSNQTLNQEENQISPRTQNEIFFTQEEEFRKQTPERKKSINFPSYSIFQTVNSNKYLLQQNEISNSGSSLKPALQLPQIKGKYKQSNFPNSSTASKKSLSSHMPALQPLSKSLRQSIQSNPTLPQKSPVAKRASKKFELVELFKFEKLINQIEVELNDYSKEKPIIEDKLQQVQDSTDQDMLKYQTDEHIESLRGGINGNSESKNYYAGAKLSHKQPRLKSNI